MTRQWKPLDGFVYDRETTLGSALRAWMRANNATDHEAAAHLQHHGVKGAIQNIDRWLRDDPAGELDTLWKKPFEKITGIDIDRLLVVEAKRQAVAGDPSLARLIRFDLLQTRRELVDAAVAHADCCYGGNYRCLAHQLGVMTDPTQDSTISHWKMGHHLPSGDDLVKLVVGWSRGLIPASCVEDCLLEIACRGMFGHTTAKLFPGARGFKDLLAAQFARLKDSRRAEDKKRVFDLTPDSVDRMRRWQPNASKLPMSSVLSIMRVAIKFDHPELLPRFDELRETFARTWTTEEATKVTASSPKRLHAPAPLLSAPKLDTIPVAANDGSQEADRPSLDALALALRGMAPGLRAIADALDPKRSAAPVASPLTLVIGETVNGLEHCLGDSGFPKLSDVQPTESDQGMTRRTFMLFRGFALALGGLDPAVRKVLNLRADLEETVLILYGLLKYEDPGAALRILESNLEMARLERARRTQR